MDKSYFHVGLSLHFYHYHPIVTTDKIYCFQQLKRHKLLKNKNCILVDQEL